VELFYYRKVNADPGGPFHIADILLWLKNIHLLPADILLRPKNMLLLWPDTALGIENMLFTIKNTLLPIAD